MTHGMADHAAGHGTIGEPSSGPDPRSALITGLTTFAWYAVPDVVASRGARAAAKSAILAVGMGLVVLTTWEGRSFRAGLASVRSAAAAQAQAVDEAADDANGPVVGASGEADALGHRVGPDVHPVLAGAAVASASGLAVAIAVAGEKWAYRRGERWRERGRAWPHARVGLLLGSLAAGLTLLEPPRAVGPDEGLIGTARPRSGAGSPGTR